MLLPRCVYESQTFRDTRVQALGVQEQIAILLLQHRHCSVISTKRLRGQLRRCPPISASLPRASSSPSCRSSSSPACFPFASVALHLPLPLIIELVFSTVVDSYRIQSMTPAWSNLLRPCVIKRNTYSAACGLRLSRGEGNLRLQDFVNVM